MPRKPHVFENVTILDVKRHSTSVNGNPTHRLVTDHGDFLTQTDSQVGYSAENYRPTYALKKYTDNDGEEYYERRDLYCTVSLITTSAGRVYNISGDDAFTLREKFES